MEYVTGSDLFTYIQDYPFDEELVRFFAAQIVLLFEYLHGNGIVFRDLKPENLLIDWRGYLKLIDFSFAKVVGDQK
jgi:protein kinase A